MNRLSLFVALSVAATLMGCADKPANHPVTIHPRAASTSRIQAQGTRVNQADTLTTTLKFKPQYPHMARLRHTQGCVNVIFDVTPKGKPVHVGVQTSVPAGVFDRATTTTIKRWRYRSTKNGMPAWSYNISQLLNYLFPSATSRTRQEIYWLCHQPSSRPVVIRRVPPAFANYVVIASYGNETIAYLPRAGRADLRAGMGKVHFCVDTQGNITDPHIIHATPDPRYGPLTVAVLQSRSFEPFKPDGSSQKLCGLTWPLAFVITWPHERYPVALYDPSCRCRLFKITILPASVLAPNEKTSTAPYIAVIPGGGAHAALCVNSKGGVTQVQITDSSGYPRLDALAIHAIGDFVFFAQRNDDGEPIPSCGWQLAIQFESRQPLKSVTTSLSAVAK